MIANTITAAYIPALHQGYINFLKKHNNPLYILDLELVREFVPRLDRDLRAMEASNIKLAVEAMGLVPIVDIVTKENINSFKATSSIIMPDEDVSHQFSKKFSLTKKASYVSTFLRWDRKISTTELEVSVDRIISTKDDDVRWITAAESEAVKSPDWWRQVGAIAITPDKQIFRSHNSPLPAHDYTLNTFGDPRSNFDAGEHIELSKVIHAEAKLIAEAAKNGTSLLGSKLYVTTFPCPNCAKLIAVTGIKEVYYSKGYSLLDAEDILKLNNIKLTLVQE